PIPGPEEQEKSLTLAKRLIAQCEQAGGVISFSDYMATVLYDPEGGYYGSGQVRFGENGDFVTAPERSPFFAMAIGHEISGLFDQGLPRQIIEFGAGSGRLAVDLLKDLAERDRLPDVYCIIEVSPALRARQQALAKEALPEAISERLQWCDETELFSDTLEGVVVANEFLDAMPVHRIRADEQGVVREMGVAWNGQRLQWQPLPAMSEELAMALQELTRRAGHGLAPGQSTELNLVMGQWLKRLKSAAGPAGLAVMLFDYGATSVEMIRPDRIDGTLRCHYRQLAHDDPFVYPGLQDITAWVDFSAVRDAALAAGFCVDVYQSQASFVIASDAPRRLENRMRDITDRRELNRLAQGFKELVMPTEMGERFRAMLLSVGREVRWQASAVRNELPRL
ncbi:MAG TPA: SAM-dependent methyltransferase, partial [Halothiobacillus sp.]|nr:SAM-dependent methyltransferase [Halothiobacillus sp.]